MSKLHDSIESKNPAEGSDIKFQDMALLPAMLKAVASVGYETPSPIQAQAIPYLLEGRDILGVAQTGTGKTAAFALPLLSNIDLKTRLPQILCLAPTRELAIQVAEAFQTYAKYLRGFNVLPVYGGADFRGQVRQLGRGVHVVVGTPGRVMDHIRRGTLVLDGLTTLVLDEADEMLSMGFIDDVEWVLQQMPEHHQTALFSATMPARVKNIADKYLQDPAQVTIKVSKTTAPGIRQSFLLLRNNEKLDTLTRIMEVEEFEAMIVFVRTKNSTLEVAERLRARGYSAEALNGDIIQNQREKTVARLKQGKIDVIVATDVAARGLDVERITHVINYDVPYDMESYINRIGRTGRAGREGDAILFVSGREKRMLQAIERATRGKIERFNFPSVDMLNERKIEQFFSRVDAVLQTDLSEYCGVIDKYIKRTGADPVLLAAAMASLEAGSEPFFIKESSQTSPRERTRVVTDEPRRERGERRPARERHDSDQLDRDEVPMETFRIEVGESHGVTKGDIVGAIANEADIDGKYIGKIRLFPEYSLVDLPEGMPKPIFKSLKKVWVCGRQMQLARAGATKGPARKATRAGVGSRKAPVSKTSGPKKAKKAQKRKDA